MASASSRRAPPGGGPGRAGLLSGESGPDAKRPIATVGGGLSHGCSAPARLAASNNGWWIAEGELSCLDGRPCPDQGDPMQSTVTRAAFLLLFCLPWLPAAAQEMPRFDLQATCR